MHLVYGVIDLSLHSATNFGVRKKTTPYPLLHPTIYSPRALLTQLYEIILGQCIVCTLINDVFRIWENTDHARCRSLPAEFCESLSEVPGAQGIPSPGNDNLHEG